MRRRPLADEEQPIHFDRTGLNAKEGASGKAHLVGVGGKPLCGRAVQGRFISATTVPIDLICKDCIERARIMLPAKFTPPDPKENARATTCPT